MIEYFTLSQTVAAVPGLSQSGLSAFLDADLVVPISSADGPMFRRLDLARLALLCELADSFDLDGDGLAVVIGLIDQLHHTRRHLHAMSQAVQAEPQDLRRRVGARFVAILGL